MYSVVYSDTGWSPRPPRHGGLETGVEDRHDGCDGRGRALAANPALSPTVPILPPPGFGTSLYRGRAIAVAETGGGLGARALWARGGASPAQRLQCGSTVYQYEGTGVNA